MDSNGMWLVKECGRVCGLLVCRLVGDGYECHQTILSEKHLDASTESGKPNTNQGGAY